MYAKLIENWLTNVNERGYQVPFCEVLLTRGYKVLYVSSHGPGEHGKDVIARDADGELWAFQLKGDRIRLSEWRRMRDEVRELVELPISFPGVSRKEKFRPVLVTNGDISPDARDNIQAYADKWAESGSGELQVWTGKHVLGMFVEAHGSYLPTQVEDFRRLAELYSLDPGDRIPRDRLLQLLTRLVMRPRVGKTAKQKRRALESMVLVGSYIVGQYESAGNHASAVEGWTCIASAVLYLASRDGISGKNYVPSLTLVRSAYEGNLRRLITEAVDSPNFVQGALILAEPAVLPSRVCLLLAWSAAAVLGGVAGDTSAVRVLLTRELPNFRAVGEVDFAGLVAVILLAEHFGLHERARSLLLSWIAEIVRANTGEDAEGIPSPYWDQEKVVRRNYGMLPNYEIESFVRISYTLLPALDMAVRRDLRAEVAAVWPFVSKITFHDFVPDGPLWYMWRADKGNLDGIHFPQPMSWCKWQEEQSILSKCVPDSLHQHPEWALPLALTMPHRANRALVTFIDERYHAVDPE